MTQSRCLQDVKELQAAVYGKSLFISEGGLLYPGCRKGFSMSPGYVEATWNFLIRIVDFNEKGRLLLLQM